MTAVGVIIAFVGLIVSVLGIARDLTDFKITANASPAITTTIFATEATPESRSQTPPSASSSPLDEPTVKLDDPATWKVPNNLLGTWSGFVTDPSGTVRTSISITLSGDGLGKGSQAGSSKSKYSESDCLMKLYLAELRLDGSIAVAPDTNSQAGTCSNALFDVYILSLRTDGRMSFENRLAAGALTKV